MSQIIFITITLFAVVTYSPVFGNFVKSMMEENLAAIALKSRISPQQSAQCFGYYNPQLTALTNEYESQYAQCIERAANATEIIKAEVAPNVAEITGLHDNICSGFSKCDPNGSGGPYSYFECSNVAADNAMTLSYSIQTISKDRMQYITLRGQMVDYDKTTCCDKCSTKYVTETTKIHTQLQACLDGEAITTTSTAKPVENETTDSESP